MRSLSGAGTLFPTKAIDGSGQGRDWLDGEPRLARQRRMSSIKVLSRIRASGSQASVEKMQYRRRAQEPSSKRRGRKLERVAADGASAVPGLHQRINTYKRMIGREEGKSGRSKSEGRGNKVQRARLREERKREGEEKEVKDWGQEPAELRWMS